MSEQHFEDEQDDDGESAANQAELVASYVAFVRRSITRRWVVAVTVFSMLLGVTLAVAKFWPRTYHCESRFIAQPNLFAPRERQVRLPTFPTSGIWVLVLHSPLPHPCCKYGEMKNPVKTLTTGIFTR